jgi:hypothetical protein
MWQYLGTVLDTLPQLSLILAQTLERRFVFPLQCEKKLKLRRQK